ncbi:hypothetical protein J4P02_01540 [Pseudomonas sp. NFXW11]|uniref:hypothetical protein n=1 Tax=Pseudomonas sp. NFXW11 TaxID=2819531 RepID=UPI003CECDF42
MASSRRDEDRMDAQQLSSEGDHGRLADETSEYLFNSQDGLLWLQSLALARPAIRIRLEPGNPQVVSCTQAPGPVAGTLHLCLVVIDGQQHKLLHAQVQDSQQLLATQTLRLKRFRTLISCTMPISQVSHTGDGVLVSTHDQALHYVQLDTPRIQPLQLTASAAGNDPLSEVIAAKNAIATFLDNLCDQLPNMVAAVAEVASEKVLDALGAQIKTQQQNLDKVFDKPLTHFIAQHNQSPSTAAAVNLLSSPANGPGDGPELRRLLLRQLNVQGFFNPFSPSQAQALSMPVLNLRASGTDPDPFEALGKLFAPFANLLNAKQLVSLTEMGVSDLLQAVSGSKPFSSVISDFFQLFKVDEAMTALHGVFGSGQLAALVGQLGLKSYLQQPVQNAFFIALYKHYFPGKTFTLGDLIAFVGALLGFVAFEVQGKGDEFQAVFSDPPSLTQFTTAPATLVDLIRGNSPHAALMLASLPANAVASDLALAAAPPAWRVGVASALSGVTTLIIGIAGVLSFGTGLIASPMVGGVAAGVSQGLFGMLQNLSADEVQWDLLSGFAGAFSGAFISTLIGNKLFASWAQNGPTPSARIQKLRLIMLGSVLTLGAGGGAVVAALVKNYAKTGQLDFDDPLALVSGAIGGLGGGAMGCGLQFMGGLSGGACLPVPLSLAEANLHAMNGLAAALPAVMSNATPLPLPNPGLPVALPGWSMAVYATQFNDPAALPANGLSLALVKWTEFRDMDNGYNTMRERLFWLEHATGAPPAPAPAADRRADLVLGVHGIGRYVFPALTHFDATGARVDFSRPMAKGDFARFLAAQPYLAAHLNNIRTNQGRAPIVKLMICFSALPLGCCSLGQELATQLNATVYAGRPPVYPWLDAAHFPRVPGWGGWIKYTP